MDHRVHRSAARRLRGGLVALVLACSSSFGAIVEYALADDHHANCVGHGFLHGASQTDGSFFARVEGGCGSGSRSCDICNAAGCDGRSVTTSRLAAL